MFSFPGVGCGGARRTIAAAVVLAGLTALAFAQTGGPDYFRIIGLKKEDNVNMRRAPHLDAKIVGKIPKDADGIKNLGCKSGLTPQQGEKASEAKKKAAARDRWCQVSYQDATGWVMERFLAEGTAPQTAQAPDSAQAPPPPAAVALPPQSTPPGVDCSKAEKHVEKLICGDRELAALDREVARLYAAASDALNATPGFEALLDSQRRWLGQRNTCFDRECLAEQSVRRIHRLRQTYAEARGSDAKGISLGPLTARCKGFPLPIAVTFVNSEPGLVYLEWPGEYVSIPQVPSGSGARYEGGFARMHVKGDSAVLKLPAGKMEMNCKLERGR